MKVAIVPEPITEGEARFRAIAGEHQAVARTAGAALDALAAELEALADLEVRASAERTSAILHDLGK